MRLVLVMLLLAALACSLTTTDNENDLTSRLGSHLNETVEAEAQISALWDRVLFGEAVSCQEQLMVPPPFTITDAEAEQHPAVVSVVEHLNAAQAALQEAVALWDWECQQARQVVPLTVVRRAEDDLLVARQALQQAIDAWHVWQP